MLEELPTPPEIAACPELVIVAVLELALEGCMRALIAAHPVLDQPERPCPIGRMEAQALGIIRRIWQLEHALACYRHRALERIADEPRSGDDRNAW